MSLAIKVDLHTQDRARNVEMLTIDKLFGTGKDTTSLFGHPHHKYSMGVRGLNSTFSQGSVLAEQKNSKHANHQDSLTLNFEMSVMADLATGAFLEVDVPPLEVDSHSCTVSIASLPSTVDSIEVFVVQNTAETKLGTLTGGSFMTTQDFIDTGATNGLPLINQIMNVFLNNEDSGYENEFSVEVLGGPDEIQINASFEWSLKFTVEDSGNNVAGVLLVNGQDGQTSAVASQKNRGPATEFASYVYGLGHAMIDRIELWLGSRCLETVYGDYMHLFNELHREPGKTFGAHLFKHEGTTLPEMKVLSTRGFKLFVDIPFFFSKMKEGSPLPLQKMRKCNDEMLIKCHFRPLKDLTVSIPDLAPGSFEAVALSEDDGNDPPAFSQSNSDAKWSFGGGAENEYPGNGAWKLVDNNVGGGSDYVIIGPSEPSPANPFYLTYDHGSKVKINRYRLFRNTSSWPTAWILEGSNDLNTDFEIIDTTYSDATSNNLVQAPTYDPNSNSPSDNSDEAEQATFSDAEYQYFRFSFLGTDDTSANFEIKVREIQFFYGSGDNPTQKVSNLWSEFNFKLWMNMIKLPKQEALMLEHKEDSEVLVRLAEPVHNLTSDETGQPFKDQNLDIRLHLRHPTTQLVWALVDDHRVNKTVERHDLTPFIRGVSNLVGPFCNYEDMNVRRTGSSVIDSVLDDNDNSVNHDLISSCGLQETPNLVIPGDRFNFRATNPFDQEIEPMEFFQLTLNGQELLDGNLPPVYYRTVSTRSNRMVPHDSKKIYTYPFAAYTSPNSDILSGNMHFGKINEQRLTMRCSSEKNPTKLIMFAEHFNIFQMSQTDGFGMKFV